MSESVDIRQTVGDRLRKIRLGRELTGADVHTAIGISRGTLWRWEAGKTEGMPASKLAALATLYRVNLDTIWFGEERQPRPEQPGAAAMSETVGFTGTRSLTPAENPLIERVVDGLPGGTRVVTGACLGVDAQVATYAFTAHAGLKIHTIVPADRSRVDPDWLGWCHTYEEMPRGTTYRDRNIRIVTESDRLIAFPDHAEDVPESRRSGTWMTIRLCRKAGKPVEIHILCSECLRRATSDDASEGGEGAG